MLFTNWYYTHVKGRGQVWFDNIVKVVALLLLLLLTVAVLAIADEVAEFVTNDPFTAPWVNTIVRGPVQ